MIAAAVKGEPFDAVLGGGAKQRSKHNTFLAIPTTFIMISNHYPTATYGNHYAVTVLGALILVGWGAAGNFCRVRGPHPRACFCVRRAGLSLPPFTSLSERPPRDPS